MKPNIQVWAIERLIPYENNAKKHDKKQVAKIAASITQFGWTQPIVVDKDGVIIAGHGRRLAGLQRGDLQVPVWIRDDLNPEQVKALRLADNRVAESSIDVDLFRQELASLDFDMEQFFDAKELEFSAADLGTLSEAAFVDDIAEAVDRQAEQTREIASASSTKPVKVVKLLGFAEVPGDYQIDISRFVAEIERQTNLKGAEAFAVFARNYVSKD